MQKILITGIGLFVIVAVVIGILILSQPPTTTAPSDSTNANSSAATASQPTSSSSTSSPPSASPGKYVSYSQSALTADTNIIFFAASWCPSCRQLDNSLQQAAIPQGVAILKADYDAETALKQKYGVTLQHTFVQVDQNGNQIKKWNGLYQSYDLDSILREVSN